MARIINGKVFTQYGDIPRRAIVGNKGKLKISIDVSEKNTMEAQFFMVKLGYEGYENLKIVTRGTKRIYR